MSIHCFFKRQFPLRSRTRGIAFLCFILLMYGCGGEESVDKPMAESVGDEKPINDVPISTIYYPMTVGSRWVYRNPDGSEWTREVTETEEVGSRLYHFFSYGPLIDDNQSDPSKTPMYTPTPYVKTLDGRLIYKIKSGEINDVVRQTVALSGRVSPIKWGIRVGCRDGGNGGECRMEKHETIYRDDKARKEINDDALMCLYFYDARVIWNGELTLLRFPLVPYRRWKAIDVRLSGTLYWPSLLKERIGIIHSFEANVTISGIAGQLEPVVTLAGAFANCLKIQYEMTRLSVETIEFRSDWAALEKLLNLLEAQLREELTTLFRDALPRMQLGTVWLAPDVGPVRIERADGISELISYDVKKGSNQRQVASGR